MPNFLLAYHGGGMPETPEAQAAVMAQWMKWFEGMGPAIVDGGNPISRAQTVTARGVSAVGDAPITGYSLLKANSLDAVVLMAKGCPNLQAGGDVTVCETFEAM